MTDDLISRQEAIRLYCREHCGWEPEKCPLKYERDGAEDCSYVRFLKDLPSVQRWIPCSERLPEDLEEVNVTWVNHDPEPYYDFVKDKPFTATAVYYKEKWYWYSSTCVDWLAEYGFNLSDEIDDRIEIIAWMPLPEPPKEETE